MSHHFAAFDVVNQSTSALDLRELLESATDYVCMLDRDWRFSFLNRSAEHDFRRGSSPLIGESLWTVFPANRGAPFEFNCRRAMLRREPVRFEAHCPPLAGWYEVHVVPVRSGGIGISLRDIADSVERNAALRCAQERFHLATQATQDVVFDWEFASGKLKWHQTTNKSLGYGREDLGQDINWWLSRIHPDDQARVKASGRGGTKMFENAMRDQAQIISSQLNLARVSVNASTVEPHYQQKVDLHTGQIVGFEALLRWRHSARGIQEPGTVAEAFKDYELATKISELMQDKVFRDIRRWIQRDVPFGRISINAAPVEFLRDDFAERLLGRMKRYKVSPEFLELEVTEHVFLERSSDYVGRALRLLYKEGVTIALDDFGTGCSSLSHLRDFPVNVVKIDRSFVERIAFDPEIMAIVSAVIDLAHSINIRVVAEGIENMEQKTLFRDEGCPLGQGYLFGKPVGAVEVLRLLAGE